MLTITAAGRLGKDSELRTIQSGEKVLSFSVAVDIRKGREKATQWVDCSVWGQRAEALAQYLTKGTSVAVVGSGSLRQWESNGRSGTSLECRVSELTLMGGGNRDNQESEPRQSGGNRSAPPPMDDDSEIPF